MSLRRPIIGVTGPDSGGAAAWIFTKLAVWLAGGHAVLITPRRPRGVSHLDGLIIGGGADVEPSLYGQELLQAIAPAKKPDERRLLWLITLVLIPLTWLIRKLAAMCCVAHGHNTPRDELEFRLLNDAVQRRLPILGICRGAQLI